MKTIEPSCAGSGASEKQWLKILSGYRTPDRRRSFRELAITLTAFVLLWVACWAAVHHGYWLGLILAVPAAGFLLRLFMLQHDCGHGAFFGRRRWDDWTGRAIGVLTLTPYDYWRRAHAEHHASAGNLDERGVGPPHAGDEGGGAAEGGGEQVAGGSRRVQRAELG